ncbi:uncharacterized protein IL334_005935 [Kwoniella shivajii]|uniref:MARVEL domain-containing protein n=1 Tax=Kwoniella shivajii TaxID=564305 RepID=A0ABZ1D566_9TREE|nr:hypothetical protein IL334_005935 [Kwoniella shivajii]
MEKLKNAFSSTTSVTSKLSKAFKFNGEHNILKRTNTALGSGRNPFLDGPVLEDPSLPKAHLIIHVTSTFFTFLAICTMGAVAGFQSKWFKVSGGTGFVLFLLLLSFILSSFLMVVPIIYDRWDKLRRPAQFLGQTRSTFILHAFGTFIMLLSAFIVTISAWTEKGCKNADDDPHADLGDTFKDDLKDWCTTKKASAVFDWLSFAAWAVLLVLTTLVFRRERRENRRREPTFIPPESTGVSYSNILAEDDERYADKGESGTGAGIRPGHIRSESTFSNNPNTGGYGYSAPIQDNAVGNGNGHGALGRPSVDAYGAFDGDMPGGQHPSSLGIDNGQSRTMQLAYNDPYAQIRASLMNTPTPSQTGYAQPQQHNQPLYGNGGLPNPPSYGGYQR